MSFGDLSLYCLSSEHSREGANVGAQQESPRTGQSSAPLPSCSPPPTTLAPPPPQLLLLPSFSLQLRLRYSKATVWDFESRAAQAFQTPYKPAILYLVFFGFRLSSAE